MKQLTMKKGSINTVLVMVMSVFFFTKAILNLSYSTEQIYDTIRDYFLYKGVVYFLLGFLSVKGIKLKNLWGCLFIFGYSVFCFIWLQKHPYGTEYVSMYQMIWLYRGFLLYTLLDSFCQKQLISWKNISKWNWGAFLLAGVLSVVIRSKVSHVWMFLLPFGVIYLMRINLLQWKILVLNLTMGYYSAFAWIMVKSFREVPYEGGRYYGIFTNHGLFGVFIGGAAVCALYWIILLSCDKWNWSWKTIGALIALLLALVAQTINGARVGQLAVLATIVFAIVFLPKIPTKKKISKRLLFTSAFCILLIGAGLLVLVALHSIDKKSIADMDYGYLGSKLVYWKNRADTIFDPDTKMGVITEGTLLNALDRFSSDRISYAVMYLRETNLLGRDFTSIEYDGGYYAHPHNTYVLWIYTFGLVGGSAYLLWLLTLTIRGIAEIIKDTREYVFSFLWLIYAMFAMLNESFPWNFTLSLMLLFLAYPLMNALEDKNVGNELKGLENEK